ncbi:hypothetical protein CHS0354_037511 [Potamilus streckersoni]|uniref:Myb/SANT-like DNA-binding domain-containing protein n=1 Tax=Potamilus streckersoni TaxID=2493646 RepID=A0AAE0RPJ9_9BIVA|nr:hypothetical protein CHS0354_037511 [Potamilus streckersoni]
MRDIEQRPLFRCSLNREARFDPGQPFSSDRSQRIDIENTLKMSHITSLVYQKPSSVRFIRRSANFSEAEKMLLITLIEEYRDTIDNRRSDYKSVREKEMAWDDVTKKFNATGFGTRSKIQLQYCWKNLKARTKGDLLVDRKRPADETSPSQDPKIRKVGEVMGTQFLLLPNKFEAEEVEVDLDSDEGDIRKDTNTPDSSHIYHSNGGRFEGQGHGEILEIHSNDVPTSLSSSRHTIMGKSVLPNEHCANHDEVRPRLLAVESRANVQTKFRTREMQSSNEGLDFTDAAYSFNQNNTVNNNQNIQERIKSPVGENGNMGYALDFCKDRRSVRQVSNDYGLVNLDEEFLRMREEEHRKRMDNLEVELDMRRKEHAKKMEVLNAELDAAIMKKQNELLRLTVQQNALQSKAGNVQASQMNNSNEDTGT